MHDKLSEELSANKTVLLEQNADNVAAAIAPPLDMGVGTYLQYQSDNITFLKVSEPLNNPTQDIVQINSTDDNKKILGKGSQGIVYQQFRNGQIVACKQPIDLSCDNIIAFHMEIEILSKLNHANVVKYIAPNDGYYRIELVMEYCSNGSMFNYLQSRQPHQVSWPQRYKWASDISKGLEYLQSLNITHNDVCTYNILLDSNFNAKLNDFGLACQNELINPLTKYFSRNNSTAPERMFDDHSVVTFACDVYSFAVVLYEIASHKTYLSELNTSDVMAAVKQGYHSEIPTETPPKYKKAIKQSWDQNPANRPTISALVIKFNKMLNSSSNIDHEAALEVSSTSLALFKQS